MKRIPMRHGVLGAALLLAALVWAFDAFTRGGPAAARGAQATPLAAPVLEIDWKQVGELVERLRRRDYEPVADEATRLQRDLFVPSVTVLSALAAAAPAPPPEPGPVEARVSVEEGFRTRHKLLGVIVGKVPLAVIDDRLWPVGAELDGCRVIDIQRDYVVLQQIGTDIRATLRLEPPEPAR